MYNGTTETKRIGSEMKKKFYVVQQNGMFVLRQERFAEMHAKGVDHPHDVCAYARSVEQMREMCDSHWPGDIDYSRVES